jgi:hypothetical protein
VTPSPGETRVATPPTEGSHPGWLRPDVLVVAGWTVLVVSLAAMRKELIGDGLRHLPHILGSWRPTLGEPRWLLFPGLLHAWLAPFKAAGLAHDMESAARAFLALDLLSGVACVLALRSVLVSRDVPAGRRAVLLSLAGLCGPLLFLSSDTAEPLVATAIALAGLAYAARRARDGGGRAVVVAVAAIALAALIYEGLFLALGFIPAVVERRTWWRPGVIAGSALVLLLMLAIFVAAGASGGLTPDVSLLRTFLQPANVLYVDPTRGSSVAKLAAVLLAGPPQGVIMLPTFRGLAGVLAGLRSAGQARWEALALLAALGVGFFAVAAAVYYAAKDRRYWVILGLASVVVLPVAMRGQYGYFKFYVLLPLFLILALEHAPRWFVLALAVIAGGASVTTQVQHAWEGREEYFERAEVYSLADARTCWLAVGWGPRFPQRWPGSSCAVLASLSAGHGSDVARLAADGRRRLLDCLRPCFCDATATWTDDLDTESDSMLQRLAAQYRLDGVDLAGLEWAPQRGALLSGGPRTPPVKAYSPEARRALCEIVSARASR